MATPHYGSGLCLLLAAIHRVGEVLAEVLLLVTHDNLPAMVPIVDALDVAQRVKHGMVREREKLLLIC